MDYGHNVGIALYPHIQCASLNYHVGITFSPHIQCAILKSHVGIAFKVPTYNVD